MHSPCQPVGNGRRAVRCGFSNQADADGIVRMKEGRTASSRACAALFCAVIHSDLLALWCRLPFDPKFVYTTSGYFLAIFTAGSLALLVGVIPCGCAKGVLLFSSSDQRGRRLVYHRISLSRCVAARRMSYDI